MFAGGVVVLVWLVVTHSLAAYLAGPAPQAALWVNPLQPEALVKLADESISASANAARSLAERQRQTSDKPTANLKGPSQELEIVKQNSTIDLSKVREWLLTAVANDPLNAHALRILGQVSSISGDDRDASAYMDTAARLSLHQGIAVFWMMRQSSQNGDYKRAIYYADALLRTDPGAMVYVEPLLAHLAEQKSSSSFVKTVLRSDPPWRGEFLKDLPGYISDARTPLDLLLALRTSPRPPDSSETDAYLEFLIAHKFYELAYYTWLQFLPAKTLRKAGLLFNGSFDIAPSGSPFDWLISQGSGVTVDIVPAPDKADGHALLVDFLFGRVDYQSVRELVVLAPGTYQFSGQYQGKLVGPRGLKWRVICAGDAETPIGESSMISGTDAAWQEVQFRFTVPPAQCRAQYVRLDLDARMASEEIVSGSILFGNLQIARAAGQPVPESTK
jgi:tetratricopeptide (TPR) repeat protein